MLFAFILLSIHFRTASLHTFFIIPSFLVLNSFYPNCCSIILEHSYFPSFFSSVYEYLELRTGFFCSVTHLSVKFVRL